MTAEQSYRVLPGPDDETLRFLDREDYEPVVVSAPIDPDVEPGNLVTARLDWSTPEPTVESLSVERRTRYAFADGIDPVFEVARETWRDAQAAGDGMNSRITRNTDGEVNGVVYVFAESERGDRFREFRDGTRPLDPLVEKANDGEPEPRAVFVLRPVDGAYVVVTIALTPDGQFARTIRDTYF
jgi:hypothetical protein